MLMIESSPNSISTTPTVLFVDLDETLIHSDLLVESCVKAMKQCPDKLLLAQLSLFQGRAAFKSAMATLVAPDASSLPYRQDVLDLLRQQQQAGVKLVLTTASPASWAHSIADHLGIFDDVLASDSSRNLKGRNKLEAIRQYVMKEEHSAWAYIGDSAADLIIFEAADHAYLVTTSNSLRRRAEALAAGHLSVLPQKPASLVDVLKAMRPHQWVKNVLVFVPLILAHAFSLPQVISALMAWICFSCVASGVYILNDMLDVESDRKHPRKRLRPFASARLSLLSGVPLFAGLITMGVTLASVTLPPKFVFLLAVYLALTTLYSVYLKNKLILDVMVLAGLYTLRVIAGGAAVDVPVSEWLMAFSIFLFTSLAFAKRYAELARLRSSSASLHAAGTLARSLDASSESDDRFDESAAMTRIHGRSYRVEDIGLIESLGPTSGYLSVLVLALYISSPQMSSLYKNGSMLWYVCPLLMYWITRLWFVAKRGKLSDDPIVFALRDGVSLFTGLIVLAVMVTAIVL